MKLLYFYSPLSNQLRLAGVFNNKAELAEYVNLALYSQPYVVLEADLEEPPAVLRENFLRDYAEVWVHIPPKFSGQALHSMFIEEFMRLLSA